MQNDWQLKLSPSSPLYHQMRSPLRLHLLAIFVNEPTRVYDAASLSQKAGILVRDIIACLSPMILEEIIEEVPIPGGRGYRLRNGGEGGLLEQVDKILKDNSQIVERYSTVRDKYFSGVIGTDEKMKIVFEMIHTIARTDATVMIIGETGTGKELVANAIHELSPRSLKPFLAVNCATLPENLFESEMFGYEKGAFTGAYNRKIGRFEQANGGTLLLDEIGDLSLSNQVKLLRALQNKTIERLGGGQSIKIDVRLIAATNRSLDEMIRNGEFREDLYYRVNVFPILIPSLRERPSDIPVLATHFLQQHNQQNFGEPWAKQFQDAALYRLQAYHWPGNVRELENVVIRLALTAKSTEITASEVDRMIDGFRSAAAQSELKSVRLEDVEKQHIRRVLRANSWNIKKTAEALGISRVTLYKKMKEYDLQKDASGG